MLKHEKVCVYTDKAFSKLSFFSFFNDFSSPLFADKPDVTFREIGGQEVSSEPSNLNFLELGITDNYVGLEVFCDFKTDGMFSKSSHCDEYKFFFLVLRDDFDHFFGDVFFGFEVEYLIAVSVVENHLIDVQ